MGNLKLHIILKRLIDEKGITLRQLAKETGVPQATLSSYLAKGGSGKPEHIHSLAKFFDCSMELLLFGEDRRGPTLDEVLTEGVFEGWLKVKIERAIPNKRKIKLEDES
jgi:transcriptional regulator with XRE-family HTH domain